MKEPITAALIVTRSISLGTGLEALLKAIPQIGIVETTGHLDEALQLIDAKKPSLVVLEVIFSGNRTQTLLEAIAQFSPNTRRVLLVDDVRHVKWMPQYAEAILIKGAPPSAFAAIVTHLLESKGEENERNDTDR